MVDITRALGRSITIVSRYGIEYYVVSLKTRDTQYRLVSVILSPALPDRTEENPAVIDDDVLDTIEVDDNERGLLYTAREVVEGITIKEEDKNDVTTDLGVESVDRFDPNKDDESDFDDVIDGDEDRADENM